MRWIVHMMLMMAALAWGKAAIGAIDISPVGGAPAVPGGWQMLSVQFTVPAGSSAVDVSVQDARGGPAVSRRIAVGGGGGMEAAQETLIVPLPLVDATSLAADLWPVEVMVRDQQGKIRERSRISLRLAPAGTAPVLRVAVPQGSRAAVRAGIPWSAISPLPVEWEEVPAQDILAGPVLEFASCDELVIPEEMRGQCPDARLAALAAAGVRIVIPGDAAPLDASGLSAWKKIGPSARGQAAWISSAAIPHPNVLEPGLTDLVDWQKPATAQPHDRRIAYCLGPAAIIAAILVSELFRRRCLVTGLWILALAGLSAGTVFYARSSATQLTRSAQWLEMPARPTASSAEPDGPALLESLHAISPLYPRPVEIAAEDGQLLYPVAASVREYWRLGALTLQLDAGEHHPSATLRGRLSARSVLMYECRFITIPEAINPEAASAFWLVEGRASHGGVLPQAPPDGATSFSGWLDAHASPAPNAPAAWYALRFDVTHRYLVSPANSPGEPFRVMDMGQSAPATAPP